MKDLIKRMIKNPARLAVKVFILIWFFLIVQIVLKVTFNYWQPYVIPTPQLQAISDFIDNNRWLEVIINGILYVINGIFVLLCSIKRWWFDKKRHFIIVLIALITNYIIATFVYKSVIATLILSIGIPLLLDRKKWLYMIATIVISNLFTALSLMFDGFTNANEMPNMIKIMLNFDYYIMLALNYIAFNLIQFKKGAE